MDRAGRHLVSDRRPPARTSSARPRARSSAGTARCPRAGSGRRACRSRPGSRRRRRRRPGARPCSPTTRCGPARSASACRLYEPPTAHRNSSGIQRGRRVSQSRPDRRRRCRRRAGRRTAAISRASQCGSRDGVVVEEGDQRRLAWKAPVLRLPETPRAYAFSSTVTPARSRRMRSVQRLGLWSTTTTISAGACVCARADATVRTSELQRSSEWVGMTMVVAGGWAARELPGEVGRGRRSTGSVLEQARTWLDVGGPGAGRSDRPDAPARRWSAAEATPARAAAGSRGGAVEAARCRGRRASGRTR